MKRMRQKKARRPPADNGSDLVWRPAQCARYLSVSRSSLHRFRKLGLLPYRIGTNSIGYDPDEVRAFARRHRAAAPR
jgi:hypothetical protein